MTKLNSLPTLDIPFDSIPDLTISVRDVIENICKGMNITMLKAVLLFGISYYFLFYVYPDIKNSLKKYHYKKIIDIKDGTNIYLIRILDGIERLIETHLECSVLYIVIIFFLNYWKKLFYFSLSLKIMSIIFIIILIYVMISGGYKFLRGMINKK